MANTLREYSPDRVQTVFAGVLIFGYADELVTIEQNEDTFLEEAGAAGDVVRTLSLNETGIVTIKLQAVSPCNDLLSALHIADKKTGAGKGPLLVKYDGIIIAQSTWAWIRKPPVQGFAREHGSREWVIACAKLNQFVKGSAR